MPAPHLGPHSFHSPVPHGRHHEWLTRFTPQQRREMIAEDRLGRKEAFGVLVGAMLFGLVILLITLTAATAL